MKRLLFSSIIILFILTACTPINQHSTNPPEAANGVLDLQNWDFKSDGAIELSGQWYFWWKELLPPEQITIENQTTLVWVPDTWTDYEIDAIELSPQGYATYYLELTSLDTKQVYGIHIDGQGSAYALWIDDKLVSEGGKVGTNYDDVVPEKRHTTILFHPDTETIHIVMQVANFNHRKGGFRNALILNLAENIQEKQSQVKFIEVFSIGILFIMGLYHLFLYFYRKTYKAPLYFALLCWMLAIRIGITNEHVLLFVFPTLGWNFYFRLEYLTFFLSPPLFALFLQNLYPKNFHRWFLCATITVGIGFSLFAIFVNTLTVSYTPTYYQVVILFEIFYYFTFLIKIIRRHEPGAWYITFASIIAALSIIIETLYLQKYLPFGQIGPYGFLAFVFVQSILLSSRFSKSFNRVEALSIDLEKLNISLQESERKYRDIFEKSKDIIFLSALDSQIVEVSPACNEVLGYTNEELQQKKVTDIMVNPDDIDHFRQIIQKDGYIKNFEVDLVKKNGETLNALFSVTYRYDESQNLLGYQGSIRDITDRKQAEIAKMRALKFEQIAITDPLTKIYNRRYFYDAAQKEIDRAKRNQTSFAIVMFDIDFYKEINDSYGHLIGDQVLINLTELCQSHIRSMDIFARLGGDEFIILMPDINQDSASHITERLRKTIADHVMVVVNHVPVYITASMGIVYWEASEPIDINTLLSQADKALYQAKKEGRNQVVLLEFR